MADRDDVLNAALGQFKEGCAAEADASGYTLGPDCAAAVLERYGKFFDDPSNGDVVQCFKAKSGKWTDAMKTVSNTGHEAVRQARSGARTGPVTVTGDHFKAAAGSVEKAHQDKLRSAGVSKAPSTQEAGNGPCTWCD